MRVPVSQFGRGSVSPCWCFRTCKYKDKYERECSGASIAPHQPRHITITSTTIEAMNPPQALVSSDVKPTHARLM